MIRWGHTEHIAFRIGKDRPVGTGEFVVFDGRAPEFNHTGHQSIGILSSEVEMNAVLALSRFRHSLECK
jgi:hypothetical protein